MYTCPGISITGEVKNLESNYTSSKRDGIIRSLELNWVDNRRIEGYFGVILAAWKPVI